MNILSRNKDKKILVDFFIFVGFFVICGLFLFQSPQNPWTGGTYGTDSSVFMTLGMQMARGVTPYLESFDHKGPLIYFLNYLGYVINPSWGIWIIEYVFLFFLVVFSYKIGKLFASKIGALLVPFLVLCCYMDYWQMSNYVEEYATTFISIALFLFLDYFMNDKISNMRLIACGSAFGAVVLLRVNMIGIWIAFCIGVFLKCIYEKKMRDIVRFLLFFISGCALVILPFVIWLGIKGALADCWRAYISFNVLYSSGAQDIYFRDKWFSFWNFAKNGFFIFSLSVCLFCVFTKVNRFLNIVYAGALFFSLLLISMSGNLFLHYGIVLVPLHAYTISYVVGLLENIEGKAKEYVSVMSLAIVMCLWGHSWLDILSYSINAYIYKDYDTTREDIKEIAQIIRDGTSDDEKIAVLGSRNIYYIKSERLPVSRYSYQMPISQYDDNIMDSFWVEVEDYLPRYFVVENGDYNMFDEKVVDFLDKYDYSCIYDSGGDCLYYCE